MMLVPPDGPKKLRKILRDLRQIVADIRYWNQHRTDAGPFDIGAELVAIDLCLKGLDAAARDDGEEYSRIAGELVRVMQEAAKS